MPKPPKKPKDPAKPTRAKASRPDAPPTPDALADLLNPGIKRGTRRHGLRHRQGFQPAAAAGQFVRPPPRFLRRAPGAEIDPRLRRGAAARLRRGLADHRTRSGAGAGTRADSGRARSRPARRDHQIDARQIPAAQGRPADARRAGLAWARSAAWPRSSRSTRCCARAGPSSREQVWTPHRPPRPEKSEGGRKFVIKSDFEPKGDQPTAIKDLVEGVEAQRPHAGAARRHRLRQDLHHGQGDRGDAAPGADPGAEQDAGRAALRRVQDLLPRQRGRVFRLLLRLLPAGSLRPAHRHLYREGILDQRADRPHAPLGDALAARARRRHHRRLGVVHLRHRLGRDLFGDDLHAQAGRARSTSASCSPTWSRCNTSAPAAISSRGSFRVRGDTIDIFPAHYEDRAWRVHLFGDEIETIDEFDPLTGQKTDDLEFVKIYANSHYVTPRPTLIQAIAGIKAELKWRLDELHNAGRLLEAQRLEQRTLFDLEMMEATGACAGIENYSRYLTGRKPGEPPPTLFEYVPDNALVFVDESHVTVPQIGGMYRGDFRRKATLAEYGFRLPSCMDNRPLRFEEWDAMRPQTVGVSATPGAWEMERGRRRVRRAGDPPDRPDRSAGRGAPGPHPGRRPGRRGPRRPRRPGLPLAGHRADQAHGRGPHRIPARAGHPRALHALRHRHAGAHRDHPRPAARRVRRAGRHQPAARGPRHSGMRAGRHPRRRQGRLPAQRDLADPDHRPRRAQHRRQASSSTPTGSPARWQRAMEETNRRREKQLAYNTEQRHHAGERQASASATSSTASTSATTC